MGNSGELWRRIHAAFDAHRQATDKDAQAALERIAAKCLGLASPKPFNRSNSLVREEMMSAALLNDLVRYHERTRPLRPCGPIVVLLHQGRRVVIDGNNRVNMWLAQNAPGPFYAIVIEPSENAV